LSRKRKEKGEAHPEIDPKDIEELVAEKWGGEERLPQAIGRLKRGAGSLLF